MPTTARSERPQARSAPERTAAPRHIRHHRRSARSCPAASTRRRKYHSGGLWIACCSRRPEQTAMPPRGCLKKMGISCPLAAIFAMPLPRPSVRRPGRRRNRACLRRPLRRHMIRMLRVSGLVLETVRRSRAGRRRAARHLHRLVPKDSQRILERHRRLAQWPRLRCQAEAAHALILSTL